MGGWVDGWVEEEEAVGMSYCESCLGGWVGRELAHEDTEVSMN